jgi:hypothetical protein
MFNCKNNILTEIGFENFMYNPLKSSSYTIFELFKSEKFYIIYQEK